jgi:DNA-binding MarR family transcriptional regulator
MRIYQRVERVASDHVRSYGLSLAQFYVLSHVGAAPGMVQQELADGLLVTKGNVVQLLDRMEANGLIERRREGRANRLYLTQVGQRLFDEVVPEHEAVIARQFDGLTADERLTLLSLLRKLDRRLLA